MQQATLYDHPTLYDRIVRPGPCGAFYRELARQRQGPILDLACGTGRLTIPLAADGHRVVGVDASAAMLSEAHAKASAETLKVEFVRGDIRTVKLKQRFALVIVGCNSLAHLTTNDDLETGLANIRRHLVDQI
jgi:2-polyprenyl-3-methyl-5-hydroxy-6-metoxy-1,4-benzoquinol methylase